MFSGVGSAEVYNQIPVREEDRPKIAFIKHYCLYVFNVLPLGLCNAPATIQRLMTGIFHDQIGKDLAPYLEDLLMYTIRHAEMVPNLDRTLGQLIEAALKCKPRNCQVFPDSIQYLGHIKTGKLQ